MKLWVMVALTALVLITALAIEITKYALAFKLVMEVLK